jgi:hypothetical protein
MTDNEKKKEEGFFRFPECFFDYGLQCFTHTEYDILAYILRNTIGWHKYECELSIKNMALMRHYSEKNIIKAVNNLVKKTNVFSKVVYREKGSCIKKTKYIITKNSVNILNDYIKNNIPPDFETKKENLKNRSLEAMDRIEQERQSLMEKHQQMIGLSKENEAVENDNIPDTDDVINYESLFLVWDEIINSEDSYEVIFATFKEYKDKVYEYHLGYVPKEKYDNKIDIKLSDLLRFTTNSKTIDLFTNLINNYKKNKLITDEQIKYLYDLLRKDLGFNKNNFDRINIIYE